VEPCRGTISSYFDLDMEIKNLSDFRLLECIDIVDEFTPFHAILNNINFQSNLEDFIMPPEESLELFVKFTGVEYMISGSAQTDFFRAMITPVLRNQLANESSYSTGTTTFYNKYIYLFSSETNFTSLGISENLSKTCLEILAPSVVPAGVYQVSNPQNCLLRIESTSLPEPISTSNFGYRLSNITLADTGWTVSQYNDYTIQDSITVKKTKELENKESKLSIVHNNYYETDGIFCSFNCCMAYIQENKSINPLYTNSEMLLLQMYNMTNNSKENLEIVPAPDWRLLTDFGGHLTIEKFRESFNKKT
jgi:hypothetical protein